MAAAIARFGQPAVHSGSRTHAEHHDLLPLLGDALADLDRRVGGLYHRIGNGLADLAEILDILMCNVFTAVHCFAGGPRSGVTIFSCI